jgi:hypothetical protein
MHQPEKEAVSTRAVAARRNDKGIKRRGPLPRMKVAKGDIYRWKQQQKKKNKERENLR